jgi:hypothetical protein
VGVLRSYVKKCKQEQSKGKKPLADSEEEDD